MTFPAPLTLCLILIPEANITVSRLGFLYGIAILAPLPTQRGSNLTAAARAGRTTVEFFERGIITTVNSPPVAPALCAAPPMI